VPTKDSTAERVEKSSTTQWVPLSEMRVSPAAQRELKAFHVNEILAEFDIEQLGILTLNYRAGHYYVVDGQHRVEVLRALGWGEKKIECEVYDGLTEQEEAEKFLRLNDRLAVNGLDRFHIGVQAGRDEDCEIEAIVRDLGLHVSMARNEGSIQAIGTLRRIYQQTGGDNLERTLRVVYTAYGDLGLASGVIDGLGLVLHRYEDKLSEADVIARLATVPGGLNALLGLSEKIKQRTATSRRFAVAAAATEILNGAKGINLGNWFRDTKRKAKAA
jgi:hypothetical protein